MRAVREQGPRLRRGRDAPGRPVAAGRPGAHRRDLQSGPPGQLHGRRDPRRPAHRLRPAHGARSRPTAPSLRKTRSPTRPRSPRCTSSTSWTSARCPPCATAARATARRTAPTCGSGSAARSTISGSRSARSTRSRTPTSGPSRIWWSSPRTTCSRSRTWARRRSSEIAELLQREGLNFGMVFEEADGELRVAATRACRRWRTPSRRRRGEV